MRSASMATKARKRLMRRFKRSGMDNYSMWVVPVVLDVDPEARGFGRNFGFSDGSVLVRRHRWQRCEDGQYHWRDSLSAYSF